MRPRSVKHIAPCPLCGHHDACRGHSEQEWTRGMTDSAYASAHKAAQEQIRGTPEWRDLNRKKRQALSPKRNR